MAVIYVLLPPPKKKKSHKKLDSVVKIASAVTCGLNNAFKCLVSPCYC